MEINPSLFGHIQNDAFLSGNYNLEAHLLSDTIAYLQNYLEKKSSTGLHAKYRSLLEDLKFLVTIEERVQTPLPLEKINGHIKTLSQDIYTKMEALSPGKRLLIPGGWLDEAGGHSMVYEIIRKENGYYFIVYNSGDGIEYHGNKSTKEKELYNPTKTWFIPLNSKSQNSEEVKLFLARLLKKDCE